MFKSRPYPPSFASCKVAPVLFRALVVLVVLAVMPIQASAEEPAVTGWFHSVAIHRPGEADTPEYWLTDDAGARVLLLIDTDLLAAHGGARALNRQRVTARGQMVTLPEGGAPAMSVSSLEIAAASAPEADLSTMAAAAASVSRPWVTVLCRFGDATGVTPRTVAWFEGLMTGTTYPGMGHYWGEASYGAVNLNGSVVTPWYNLPQPRSAYLGGGMDLGRLATDCTSAAAAAVNFPTFFGINLIFNGDLPVSVGGTWLLTVDGQTRYYAVTWIPNWGFVDQGLVAHEMGHGFGFPHSSGPYGQTYDSRWDVMSDWADNCRTPHPTYGCVGTGTIAHHKNLAGWIPAGRRFVAGAGTLETIILDRLALPEGTTSYLMAIIPIAGSATRFYTVEARDLAGYDAQLPARAVIIHKVDTSLASSEAQVVDVDRNRNPNDAAAIWLPGETFADPANGIAVTVVAAEGSGFRVSIASSPAATAALAVARAGAGSGTVTSTPSGIACGTDCSETYAPLTEVRLRAAAAAGSVFAGWSGGGCAGTADCVLSLASAVTVTATFEPASALSPDLAVAALGGVPATAARGARFRVTDTVANRGDGPAAASRTRYYFSANAARDGSDVLLTGVRTVRALAAGATASGSITVTVPTSVPAGPHFLLACADDLGAVAERDEANNCTASATAIEVQAPDLVAVAVSNPPAAADRGARFRLSDSVRNEGSAPAPGTRVRYYLSRDGSRDASDALLIGTRAIARMMPGAISAGTVTATIPTSTAAGSYYVLACADDLGAARELSEANNCRASTSRVAISP